MKFTKSPKNKNLIFERVSIVEETCKNKEDERLERKRRIWRVQSVVSPTEPSPTALQFMNDSWADQSNWQRNSGVVRHLFPLRKSLGQEPVTGTPEHRWGQHEKPTFIVTNMNAIMVHELMKARQFKSPALRSDLRHNPKDKERDRESNMPTIISYMTQTLTCALCFAYEPWYSELWTHYYSPLKETPLRTGHIVDGFADALDNKELKPRPCGTKDDLILSHNASVNHSGALNQYFAMCNKMEPENHTMGLVIIMWFV